MRPGLIPGLFFCAIKYNSNKIEYKNTSCRIIFGTFLTLNNNKTKMKLLYISR